jgi:hypothetical protein
MKNLSFLGFPMYAVSRAGSVFSLFTNRFLKPILGTSGYYSVTLQDFAVKKNFTIHRLVALCYIPQIDGKPHVNHIDGCKTNNAVSNLEWVTAAENSQHAITSGLRKDFKRTYRPVSDAVVHSVCALISQSWRNCDIANATGVDSGLVAKIRAGTHYPDISGQYDFSSILSSRRKVSDTKAHEVCVELQRGTKWTVIMRELGVSYSTVRKIFDKTAYCNISDQYVFHRS